MHTTHAGVEENQWPAPQQLPSQGLCLQQASEVVCRCVFSAVSGERSVNETITAISSVNY